jgi:hypothetical protein
MTQAGQEGNKAALEGGRGQTGVGARGGARGGASEGGL